MTATADPRTDDEAALAAKVDTLEAEQAAVPDALKAAQRGGDPKAWLAVQDRADDLPEELRQAKVRLLTLQFRRALADLEPAREADRQERAQALADLERAERDYAAAQEAVNEAFNGVRRARQGVIDLHQAGREGHATVVIRRQIDLEAGLRSLGVDEETLEELNNAGAPDG